MADKSPEIFARLSLTGIQEAVAQLRAAGVHMQRALEPVHRAAERVGEAVEAIGKRAAPVAGAIAGLRGSVVRHADAMEDALDDVTAEAAKAAASSRVAAAVVNRDMGHAARVTVPSLARSLGTVERPLVVVQRHLVGLRGALHAVGSGIGTVGDAFGRVAEIISTRLLVALVGAAGYMGAVGVAFAGVTGAIGAYVGAMGLAVGFGAKFAEDQNNLAAAANLSVEKFAALASAGRRFGVEAADMSSAVGALQDKIVDAMAGDLSALGLFQQLGVSLVDSKGEMRSVEDVLGQVADAFARVDKAVGDGWTKNKLAESLFGSDSQGLIRLLSLGRKEMSQLVRQADFYGTSMSRAQAMQARALMDALRGIREAGIGIWFGIVERFGPAFQAAFADLENWLLANRGRIIEMAVKWWNALVLTLWDLLRAFGLMSGAVQQGWVQELVEHAQRVWGWLVAVWGVAVDLFKVINGRPAERAWLNEIVDGLAKAWALAGAAWQELKALEPIVKAVWEAFDGFARSIGFSGFQLATVLVAAQATGILGLLGALSRMLLGVGRIAAGALRFVAGAGKGILLWGGRIVAAVLGWPVTIGVSIGLIIAYWDELKAALGQLWDQFRATFPQTATWLEGAWKGLVDTLKGVWRGLSSVFPEVASALETALSGMGALIGTVFGEIKSWLDWLKGPLQWSLEKVEALGGWLAKRGAGPRGSSTPLPSVESANAEMEERVGASWLGRVGAAISDGFSSATEWAFGSDPVAAAPALQSAATGAAASGTPVNIVLDGKSYPTRATPSVAAELARAGRAMLPTPSHSW